MKLYGYWRSSSSWRVRLALEWKGLPYEYAAVHLLRDGGEQHTEAHLARNPMGQIPVLELADGTQLSQSLAILEYLEEIHPSPALLPEDPIERATARQLAEIVNAGIQPLQNLAILQTIKGYGADEKAWAARWVSKGLEAFEKVAASSSATYSVGDSVSIADVCLVPQLYSARRFAVDLEPYPNLRRIEEACAALPAFQAAHADRQPDAVL